MNGLPNASAVVIGLAAGFTVRPSAAKVAAGSDYPRSTPSPLAQRNTTLQRIVSDIDEVNKARTDAAANPRSWVNRASDTGRDRRKNGAALQRRKFVRDERRSDRSRNRFGRLKVQTAGDLRDEVILN